MRFLHLRNGCSGIVAASVLSLASIAAGPGAIFWDNPFGGSFQNDANWLGGISPGASDSAEFNLGSVAGYTVNFASSANTDRMRVRNDNVTFDLNGFTYSMPDPIDSAILVGVDLGEIGQLRVLDGTLSGRECEVGYANGSEGTLTIDGVGTTLTTTLHVSVGSSGNGTFNILNGGQVTTDGIARIAWFPGSSGDVTVDGLGSRWEITGDTVVGENGPGTFDILNGGDVAVGSAFRVGTVAGLGSGNVTVASGSTLEVGNDLIVAQPGVGPCTLSVQDAGTAVSVSSALLVGLAGGQGEMTITNGATVESFGGALGVFGGHGEVIVAGLGSSWFGAGELNVGSCGLSSSMTVSNSAVVSFPGVNVAAGAGATAELTVTGVGSRVDGFGSVNACGAGVGLLTIADGAQVSNRDIATADPRDGYVGIDYDSDCTAVITGVGSEWKGIFFLTIGGVYHTPTNGKGMLIVENGGHVSNIWGEVPDGGAANGTVIVRDSGSTWTNFGPLQVGIGDGQVTIENGGKVLCDVLEIGITARRTAQVTVRDVGSSLECGSWAKVGLFANGELVLENGGQAIAPSFDIRPFGTILGFGVLEGNTLNSGRVSPGLSSGVLTIVGNLQHGSQGLLAIEIGGLTVGTEYDRLAVTGNADLQGTLDLSLIDGFTPSAGDSFDILTYASQSGRFDTIIGSSPAPGLRWALDYNPTALTLIACDPVADPSCDDCNLNGGLDGEDIANATSLDLDLNGIPDECSQFVDACVPPSNDWSCFDNWDLPGDQYPDDVASAPDIFVTLNSSDDVFLDVNATIPAMRILDGSTLRVSQSGAGDLTVNSDKGILIDGNVSTFPASANLLSGNDRTINVPFGTVKIGPEGRYAEDPDADGSGCTPPDAGYACSTLSAARIEILPPHCETPTLYGGSMDLTDSMSVSTTGDLVITGDHQLDCGGATAGITPPPKLRLRNLSWFDVATAFTMTGAVEVTINTAGESTLSGNFDNRSAFPSLFDWMNGTLTLNGSGQAFEVAGVNLGQTTEGYNTNVDTFFDTDPHTNFSMSSIEVAGGATVTFANVFGNTAGGGCAEALYVHDLIFRAGSTVTIDNCKVYYTTLTNEGVTPILLGCGELLSDVPPPSVVPGPTGPATRTVSMTVPAFVTASGSGAAVKITMVELQNPVPANLPQYPPPDFSGFEVNTCGDPGGCARWVGKPGIFLESQDSPGLGSYKAARLQCTPYFHDFAAEGLIHVTGAEIVPSSTYEVRVYASSCEGNESTCSAVSVPVTMVTRRSGDVGPNFNPPAPSTQPDALDVAAVVNKLKNLPGALVKSISQLQPNLPELNADVNALDIVAVVDAVKQKAYAFSGPCACPSVVTCGALACPAGPGVCVTAYGAGAMCVKTCTGGTNMGDACINNSHCPGSTCGAGSCRDRCGRCTP